MGFHVCEYCFPQGIGGGASLSTANPMFSPYSSADVTLTFTSGRTWQFPHVGLLHYITEHNYLPPADFVHDVMNGSVVDGDFLQTKWITQVALVGYLQGHDYPNGAVPAGFVEKLLALVEQAKSRNDHMGFRQTRSIGS